MYSQLPLATDPLKPPFRENGARAASDRRVLRAVEHL